jgi:hypothetical protein
MPPSANISTSSNSGNAIANGAWSYHQTQTHQQQRQQFAPADYQQHQQFPFPIGEFNQNTNNHQQQPSRIQQPSMDYQQQHPNAPQIADEVAVGHFDNMHFEYEAVVRKILQILKGLFLNLKQLFFLIFFIATTVPAPTIGWTSAISCDEC